MRARIFSAVPFLLKYVFCYSALTARFIVLPHAFTMAIVDAPANAPRGCFATVPEPLATEHSIFKALRASSIGSAKGAFSRVESFVRHE